MLIPINLIIKKLLNIQKLLLIFCLFQILTETGFAQAGTLDSSFGNKGLSLLSDNKCGSNVFSTSGYNVPMVIQNDQKVLVVGSVCNEQAIEVFRLNTNGSIDKTYGINGKSKIFLKANSLIDLRSAVLDKKGRLIIGGNFDGKFLIIRLNVNGSVDSSFGKAGIVSYQVNAWCILGAIAAQKDNKIIALGSSSLDEFDYSHLSAVRFNVNGIIDSSFGINGIALLNKVDAFASYGSALVLQRDGKIICGGAVYDDSGVPYVLLTRYNTNGTLDLSFGGKGYIETMVDYFLTSSEATSVVLEKDDIVVYGFVQDGFDGNVLIRYKPNGLIDSSFGVNGIVHGLTWSANDPKSLSVQTDGKIISAGYSFTSNGANILVGRFNVNGSIDNSFGNNNGSTAINITGGSYGSTSVVEQDGKILVSAKTAYNVNGSLIVSRFNATPAPKKSNDISSNIYADNKIIISPNPVRDMLTIQGIPNSGIATIVDLTGKVISKTKISAGSFSTNVSSLSKGIYYITITTNNKNTVLKFLKE